MDRQGLWERAAAFHGHVCGGLAIGYQAALYAAGLLGLTFSEDEQVVCVAENDACGVDAVQAVLGCSVGRGNLLFHLTGKQAFSFYNRATGQSVRLVLRPGPEAMGREEALAYYRDGAPERLFDVKKTTIRLPERARMFASHVCENCGEAAGEQWIRLSGGKKLCVDCWRPYRRFDVG